MTWRKQKLWVIGSSSGGCCLLFRVSNELRGRRLPSPEREPSSSPLDPPSSPLQPHSPTLPNKVQFATKCVSWRVCARDSIIYANTQGQELQNKTKEKHKRISQVPPFQTNKCICRRRFLFLMDGEEIEVFGGEAAVHDNC